jgi:hypothetical protein
MIGGCTTAKQMAEKNKATMDSWLGHHKSELIQSWGPPSRYEDDGKGGQILIYERKQIRGTVVYNTYYEKTSYPYNMFYADSEGKIYYWRIGS